MERYYSQPSDVFMMDAAPTPENGHGVAPQILPSRENIYDTTWLKKIDRGNGFVFVICPAVDSHQILEKNWKRHVDDCKTLKRMLDGAAASALISNDPHQFSLAIAKAQATTATLWASRLLVNNVRQTPRANEELEYRLHNLRVRWEWKRVLDGVAAIEFKTPEDADRVFIEFSRGLILDGQRASVVRADAAQYNDQCKFERGGDRKRKNQELKRLGNEVQSLKEENLSLEEQHKLELAKQRLELSESLAAAKSDLQRDMETKLAEYRKALKVEMAEQLKSKEKLLRADCEQREKAIQASAEVKRRLVEKGKDSIVRELLASEKRLREKQEERHRLEMTRQVDAERKHRLRLETMLQSQFSKQRESIMQAWEEERKEKDRILAEFNTRMENLMSDNLSQDDLQTKLEEEMRRRQEMEQELEQSREKIEEAETESMYMAQERRERFDLKARLNEVAQAIETAVKADILPWKLAGSLNTQYLVNLGVDEIKVSELDSFITRPPTGFEPYKVDASDPDNPKRVLNRKDENIVKIIEEHGEDVAQELLRAILELERFNASGQYNKQVAWHSEEDRDLREGECVKLLVEMLKKAPPKPAIKAAAESVVGSRNRGRGGRGRR